jgi:hypothetical protein
LWKADAVHLAMLAQQTRSAAAMGLIVLKKSGLSEIGRLWRNNDSSGVGVLNH